MKKLKGNDGIVRRFQTSQMDEVFGGDTDTICLECNHNFSCHSWNFYKEKLKQHVCIEGVYVS